MADIRFLCNINSYANGDGDFLRPVVTPNQDNDLEYFTLNSESLVKIEDIPFLNIEEARDLDEFTCSDGAFVDTTPMSTTMPLTESPFSISDMQRDEFLDELESQREIKEVSVSLFEYAGELYCIVRYKKIITGRSFSSPAKYRCLVFKKRLRNNIEWKQRIRKTEDWINNETYSVYRFKDTNVYFPVLNMGIGGYLPVEYPYNRSTATKRNTNAYVTYLGNIFFKITQLEGLVVAVFQQKSDDTSDITGKYRGIKAANATNIVIRHNHLDRPGFWDCEVNCYGYKKNAIDLSKVILGEDSTDFDDIIKGDFDKSSDTWTEEIYPYEILADSLAGGGCLAASYSFKNKKDVSIENIDETYVYNAAGKYFFNEFSNFIIAIKQVRASFGYTNFTSVSHGSSVSYIGMDGQISKCSNRSVKINDKVIIEPNEEIFTITAIREIKDDKDKTKDKNRKRGKVIIEPTRVLLEKDDTIKKIIEKKIEYNDKDSLIHIGKTNETVGGGYITISPSTTLVVNNPVVVDFGRESFVGVKNKFGEDLYKAWEAKFGSYEYEEVKKGSGDQEVYWISENRKIFVSDKFKKKYFDDEGYLKENKEKFTSINTKEQAIQYYMYNILDKIVSALLNASNVSINAYTSKDVALANSFFANITPESLAALCLQSVSTGKIPHDDYKQMVINNKLIYLSNYLKNKNADNDIIDLCSRKENPISGRDDYDLNVAVENFEYIVYTWKYIARRQFQLHSMAGSQNGIPAEGMFSNRKNEPFGVLIPLLTDALPEEDVLDNSSRIRDVEDFITNWRVKGEINSATNPTLKKIDDYYNVITGMTPFIQVGLKYTGLHTGSQYYTVDSEGKRQYSEEAGNFIINQDGARWFEFKETENGLKLFGYKEGDKFKPLGIGKDRDSLTYEIQETDRSEVEKIINENYYYFNTLNTPFIQSATISDNGVKKLTLKLLDPDFKSWTYGIGSEGIPNDIPISLEALLRDALRNSIKPPSEINPFVDEKGPHYVRKEGEETQMQAIESNYLKFDKDDFKLSPTNLRIRFGYADCMDASHKNRWNQNLAPGNSNSAGLSNITIPQDAKYIINKEGNKTIDTAKEGGVHLDAITNRSSGLNDHYNPKPLKNQNLTTYLSEDLPAKTTTISPMIDFMITGFESKITSNGIEYNITAIETKDGDLLKTRYLQRYAEITSYPEEVLYILEHLFNEDNKGNNIVTSNIKICLLEDDYDREDPKTKKMVNRLNMEYDLKALTDIEKKYVNGCNDIYSAAYNNEGGEMVLPEKALKNITLNLGGDQATRNYSMEKHVPLYKSVTDLMNEFCAACPPKRKMKIGKPSYDSMGNEIGTKEKSNVSRPLKWFAAKGANDETDTTYICLYYRTIQRPKYIRYYTYGPHNPQPSCIKDLSIKNSNEFAILNAIKTFDPEKQVVISRTADGNTIVQQIAGKDTLDGYTVNAAGFSASHYDDAYANSMYSGEITILGDPFYLFNGTMQPMTYPIKLDIVLPKTGNGTWNNYSKFFGKTASFKNNDGQEGNQVLHDSSGYYVIKDVTHEISTSGYYTKLNVISYPNIQNDIFMAERSTEEVES